MILLLDNYDSFTYNLYQAMATLTAEPIEVIRNDKMSVEELLALEPRAIVVSPGPSVPEKAGESMALIEAAQKVPLLGICLGLQALAAVHGAKIVRAPDPVHGKTDEISHDGASVFEGLPSPFVATRYHSLVIDEATLPERLRVTARTPDGLIMGIEDSLAPHHGVQFHPESYLCEDGPKLLARFLEIAGVDVTEMVGA